MTDLKTEISRYFRPIIEETGVGYTVNGEVYKSLAAACKAVGGEYTFIPFTGPYRRKESFIKDE